MPRTKIPKSSKRNREAAQLEERVREYDTSVDQYLIMQDTMGRTLITEVESEINMLLKMRINKNVLQMKLGDFFELNLGKFEDYKLPLTTHNCSAMGHSNISGQSMCEANALMPSMKVSNPNDEGYLTEDSTKGGSSMGSLATLTNKSLLQVQQQQQQQNQRGRTPGPLNSARARRPRRSKSVCSDYIPGGTAIKQKPLPSGTPSLSEHASRNKLRTPLVSRTKAFSADRASKICPSSPTSPVTAFMRWPKPGEMVMSMCGSPVVAQMLPDKYANVNIPVRNGVLSLRPKKISELHPELIESIDPETLKQIRTLHANLNIIMKMADKAVKN